MSLRMVRAILLAAMLGCTSATSAHAADGDPVNSNDWIIGILAGNKARQINVSGTFVQDSAALFNTPIGIDTGPDGNIYICDFSNNRIVQFAKTNFQISAAVVSVNEPQAITFGPDGDLYVARSASGLNPNVVARYAGPLAASPFTLVSAAFALGLNDQIGFQDLAFGPGGDLYVSNWKTVSAAPDPSVERFDGITGAHIESFVPTTETNLDNTRGMTFGPNGDLYVVNMPIGTVTGQVVRFQGPGGVSPGTFVSDFVDVAGNGGMDLPQIPRFGSDGNLYVTGFFSDALKYYQGPNGAAPGTYIGNFTTFSGGSQPLGLTQVADTNEVPGVLTLGDWFVGTLYAGHVRRYDVDGTGKHALFGTDPRGIAIGPLGDVYVADDSGGGRVKRFARTNLNLAPVVITLADPNTMAFDVNGDLYVQQGGGLDPYVVRKYGGPTNVTPFADLSLATSGGAGNWIGFQDMEFGPDGNLYVANFKISGGANEHSVERFNGTTLVHIDTYIADGEPNLDNITGLAFGPDGHLYIGNKAADGEILKYQGPGGGSPGTFMQILTPTGNGLGLTQDLDFGSDGNIYCANFWSNTVTRYQGPDGALPGTFIDAFVRLPFNSTGATTNEQGLLYMDHAKLPPPPPPPPKGILLLVH